MGEKFGVGFFKEYKYEVIHKEGTFEWGDLGTFLVEFLNNGEDSKLKKDFIEVIDYIYNVYALEELEGYTTYERYYKFINSKKNNGIEKYARGIRIDTSIDVNLFLKNVRQSKNNNDHKGLLDRVFSLLNKEKSDKELLLEIPYFFVGDKGNILFLILTEVISLNIVIRQCKNCGKYFIPVNRSDELYCSNEYKDGKTCKQVGFWQIKKKKYEEDELARLYRNTYQQKFLRVKRNPDNKEYAEDFERFKEGVKKMREAVFADEKTEEEFKKWLIEVKNEKVN